MKERNEKMILKKGEEKIMKMMAHQYLIGIPNLGLYFKHNKESR